MNPENLEIWNSFTAAPVQHVSYDGGPFHLYIKRLDLIQSWATGNKYYKLKYNLRHALADGIKTVVSKGGMFSNHLDALTEACHAFDIKCICVVRSYKVDENNPSIHRWVDKNAELLYLSPHEYGLFDERRSSELYSGAYFIPEGGSNKLGILGSAEILSEDEDLFDCFVLPGGTMSTFVGILSNLVADKKVIIVPAWKGCTKTYIEDLLAKYEIHTRCKWEVWPDYHFGGFGRYNTKLADFMYSFSTKTGIPLDPVYTGKMMYAIHDKMQSGYFKNSDRVMAIHTGGLQGMTGFKYMDPKTWGHIPV